MYQNGTYPFIKFKVSKIYKRQDNLIQLFSGRKQALVSTLHSFTTTNGKSIRATDLTNQEILIDRELVYETKY